MTNRRSAVGLVVTVLVAALLWWMQSGDGGPAPADHPSSGSYTTLEPLPDGSPATVGVDPASGLPLVRAEQLPAEALDALFRIRTDGPYPYDEDGGTFGNYEGLLPEHDRGYYREFTVDTPGSDDRGARRIIVGDEGELYWTADHYVSFQRIRG